MKKTTVLIVALTAAFASHAQINTTKKKELSKQLPDKPLTIKTTPPATASKPASTGPVTIKQPSLKLTSLEVLATASGNGTYQLTITYGARNDSASAVRLDQLSLQGYVVLERDTAQALGASNAYMSGCGVSGRPVTDMLQPAGRTKDVFQCFNKVLNPAEKPYYLLTLKFISNPREQNVPLSSFLVPIRFQ